MNPNAVSTICARIVDHTDFYLRGVSKYADTEPTKPDIINCLKELLNRDPAVFLERYGKLIPTEALKAFSSVSSDYEVAWHLKQLGVISDHSSKRTKNLTRNRRLHYLKKKLLATDYFSETSMQMRAPSLYNFYIAQHKALEEIDQEKPLYEILMVAQRGMDEKKKIKDNDSSMDVDGEEQEDEKVTENEGKENLSVEEKKALAEEFLDLMKQRFINGKDEKFFNYAEVDNNPENDDLSLINDDMQDAYFDD